MWDTCLSVTISCQIMLHNFLSNYIFGVAVSPELTKILPIEVFHFFYMEHNAKIYTLLAI